jgi:hypothetical protein
VYVTFKWQRLTSLLITDASKFVDSQTARVYEQNDNLYLETFLIDITTTKKGKRVNDQSIDSNVLASNKHPLTLYPKQSGDKWIWDHPVIETNSLSQNLELQKKYEIGQSVRLKKVKDGSWNAVYEITDPGAKKLFKQYLGQTIPFWTSSGIIHSSKENPLDIKDWRIIHNAVVSEPANGFEKAQIVDICSGTEQTCSAILTASVSSIPFCTATNLSNYISSLSSVSGIFPHYSMSSESSQSTGAQVGSPVSYNQGFTDINAKTGMGSVPNSLTPPNPNPPQQTTTEEPEKKQTKEDKTDYKSKVKELEEQLNLVNKEKQTKDQENKTVTERLASLERENVKSIRKNQVLGIVQQYPEAFLDVKTGQPNQELYSKTVLEWIDKNYDDNTIAELLEAKTLKWVNAVQNPNSKCSTCASMTPTTSKFQTTQMTTASVSSDSDSSLPIWEKIIDLTNARIRLSAEKYQQIGGSSY